MIYKKKKRRRYLKALQTNYLLKDMAPEEMEIFLDQLQEDVWHRNTCSIDQPLITSRFHFIVSGRLKIYKLDDISGREFTLFLLRKNDVFDLLCLLDGCEHEVFYQALDRLVLLHLPMEKMKQWVREHPGINRNMLPYLSRRMRILEEYAASITLVDISTRLAKLILNNINSQSKELELINDLSNEEIANLIGSTRAVVNRHLQIFKQEGILNLGRQKVEIVNLNLLLKKAHPRGGKAAEPI